MSLIIESSDISAAPMMGGEFGDDVCARGRSRSHTHVYIVPKQARNVRASSAEGPERSLIIKSSDISAAPMMGGEFGDDVCACRHARGRSRLHTRVHIMLKQARNVRASSAEGPERSLIIKSSDISAAPMMGGKFGDDVCARGRMSIAHARIHHAQAGQERACEQRRRSREIPNN